MIQTHLTPTRKVNFTGDKNKKTYRTGSIIGGAVGAGASIPAIELTARHCKPVNYFVNGIKKVATLSGSEISRLNDFLKGQRLSDIKAVNQYSVSKLVKSKKVIFSGEAGRVLNNWVRTWGKMTPSSKIISILIPSTIAGLSVGLGSELGKKIQKRIKG